MAAAGTVAVLLPGAYYFLRETKLPPVAALRAPACRWRWPPTTTPARRPVLSLLLMLNMACTLFRLTPEEALARHHRARARARSACRPRPLRRACAPTSRSGTPLAPARAGLPLRPQPLFMRRHVTSAWRPSEHRMSEPTYTLHQGSTPLLISLPHVGTGLPRTSAAPGGACARSSRTPTGTSTGSVRLRPRPRRGPARAAPRAAT
jgi:hypothetical protein